MKVIGNIYFKDKGFEKKLKIVCNRKFYSKNNIRILLFGNISEMLSNDSDFKLEKYENKQEELILKLYKQFGENFIKFLDGYFLILVHDKNKKDFFIFNNKYSNTFCYYHISKDKFTFADSIKKVLKNTKIQKEPNMDMISLFLNSGYTFCEKTVFKNIYRMIPGFYMKIDLKNNKIVHKKYYEMKFNRKPIKNKNINKALDDYEKIWISAVKDFAQTNKTKNLGSTLSGGIDTSWVVWCATQAFNKPTHTYTCKYDFTLFNENKQAKYVTNKCKGKYHEVIVDEKDLDLIPEIIRAAEEPVLSSSLSLYKLVKASGKHVDTLLTGDGGNNIYHHLYPVSEIHKYIRKMPYFIRKSLFYIIDFIAKITRCERLWELRYTLHAFSFKNFYNNFFKNLICYRHFDSYQREQLFKPRFFEEFKEKNMLGNIPIRKNNFDNDLIHARMVHGNMEYVSTFHEKFAKQFGIKLYPPYQTQKIMDFINSLPMNFLFKGNSFQKLTNRAYKMRFAKLALKRHFPAKFVDKTGQPFDQPFHSWFEKRPKIVDLLLKRLKKRGWYNEKYLDKLYREHKKQKQHKKIFCQLRNHGYRIMALLVLEIWCMEFLDNNSSRLMKRVPLETYLKL